MSRERRMKKIQCTEDFFRRLLIGMLVRLRHLHFEGKTLNGCFLAENICVPLCEKDKNIPGPYIEVKLGHLQLDSFMPYTEDRGDKDLVKLGWILENQVFSPKTKLPSDVKQLVELLSNTPIKDQDLIYGHVGLMSAKEKVSHFLWLYKRLLYLKKRMPSKYKTIMQKITDEAQDWRKRAEKNKFLAKLKPRWKYSRNAEGLARFYRNAVEHLFKMFEGSEFTFEEELEDYHIIYILTGTFPELLGDLQKAFHEEGEFQALIVQDFCEGLAGSQTVSQAKNASAVTK
ncbi:hypothetical protein BS78_03G375500 [Paspalum vaginatum]|nr:hypothetical protein BS78_03G375500 [Paspalum vaginatum]